MVEIEITPYRSWAEVQTRPGYQGIWKSDAGWLFFRVWDRIKTEYLYDLYGALTANAVRWGSGAAPTAGSVFPYTILMDATVPPRRILRHERANYLWEVFPTLNHPSSLMYLRIPQSQPRGGMTNEIGNCSAQFTDPYGYWFQGKDSDIDNPTEAGRFFIPPFNDTEIAIVNTENYEIRPQTFFIINQLEIKAFDPRTQYGKDMIKRILADPSRATMGTAGAEPYRMSADEFEKYFQVPPVKWDGSTATYKDTKTNTMMPIGEVR